MGSFCGKLDSANNQVLSPMELPRTITPSVHSNDDNYPVPNVHTPIVVSLKPLPSDHIGSTLNLDTVCIKRFTDSDECLNFLRSAPSSNVYLHLPNESDADSLLSTAQRIPYVSGIYVRVQSIETIQWPVLYSKVKIHSNREFLVGMLLRDLKIALGAESTRPVDHEQPETPPPSPSFWDLPSEQLNHSMESAVHITIRQNQPPPTDLDPHDTKLKNDTFMNVFHHDQIEIGSLNAQDMKEENATFMWVSLLIDVLLKLPPFQEPMKEMIAFCREETTFDTNSNSVSLMIDELEQSYVPADAINWYTRDSFLFYRLNQALRAFDIDKVFVFRQYIQELHKQITVLQAAQKQMAGEQYPAEIVVWRGQGLNTSEAKTFLENIGSLTQFYSFTSTSTRHSIACGFASTAKQNGASQAAVFEIHIDTSIHDFSFADISKVSTFTKEFEVLLSMGMMCRIDKARVDASGVLYVKLLHTRNTDPALQNIFAYYKKQIEAERSVLTLANILVDMGDFTRAECYYDKIYKALPDGDPDRARSLNNRGLARAEHGDYSKALDYYGRANTLVSKDDMITKASILNNMGMAYYGEAEQYSPNATDKAENLNLAESSLKASLQLKRQFVSRNSSSIAVTTSNIGLVYQLRGEFREALRMYEDTKETLRLSGIPAHDALISANYHNISAAQFKLEQYDEAWENSSKALEIEEATRPRNPNVMKYRDHKQYIKDHRPQIQIDTNNND